MLTVMIFTAFRLGKNRSSLYSPTIWEICLTSFQRGWNILSLRHTNMTRQNLILLKHSLRKFAHWDLNALPYLQVPTIISARLYHIETDNVLFFFSISQERRQAWSWQTSCLSAWDCGPMARTSARCCKGTAFPLLLMTSSLPDPLINTTSVPETLPKQPLLSPALFRSFSPISTT